MQVFPSQWFLMASANENIIVPAGLVHTTRILKQFLRAPLESSIFLTCSVHGMTLEDSEELEEKPERSLSSDLRYEE